MIPPKEQQRPPGFDCPKCGFFIEMSIESLLYSSSQVCPGCTTAYSMDREKSNDALKLVQKLHVAMKNIDTVKKFDGKH
ncbi:MAG: hypothetical protein JWO03_2992 [Bacteroidetes bacterium]|nr:hypothetical protein [Bacteroidota bacterium]